MRYLRIIKYGGTVCYVYTTHVSLIVKRMRDIFAPLGLYLFNRVPSMHCKVTKNGRIWIRTILCPRNARENCHPFIVGERTTTDIHSRCPTARTWREIVEWPDETAPNALQWNKDSTYISALHSRIRMRISSRIYIHINGQSFARGK